MRSVRTPPARHRKSLSTATMVSGMTRTSPAEPVVSFAQADGFETMSRMIKGGSRHASPHRARSPYPVARGRRSSLLRSRLKVSDQDLADSLQSTGLTEKFGLERFLPPVFRGARAWTRTSIRARKNRLSVGAPGAESGAVGGAENPLYIRLS